MLLCGAVMQPVVLASQPSGNGSGSHDVRNQHAVCAGACAGLLLQKVFTRLALVMLV
jgi:hypothetical protein